MPAAVAGISCGSTILQSGDTGHGAGHGHRPLCSTVARSPAVKFSALGTSANVCSQRLCIKKVPSKNVRRRARGHACSLNTLTTDVYQQDEQGAAQTRKQEHESGIDLKQWMHEQGLPDCKVALAEHKPWIGGKGRPIHYVVASQDLQPGEVALAVPKSLVVTLEKVLGDETIGVLICKNLYFVEGFVLRTQTAQQLAAAELLTTNKLSELACLALYLMYEKKQGKESYWYPYIRELDRQRGRGQLAVESPLLWSQAELNEYFTGSPMREVVLERLAGIKREYQELDTVWFMAGSLFKQYPFDLPSEAFSFEIFKQAFVAVQSCVVHLQGVSLARRFALVPLGPPLLAYKSNCKAMLKAVGDFVQLEVDRAYKAGDPISVWCGPQPNSRLLLNYGFVDEDNPYDRISVEASLETEDPLYQHKRSIVQKNDRLTVQTFQMYKGKEMEAVLDMLPYMRLGHLSDPAEMESVIFAQGPVCPVSPCNERAVLDQLVNYFKRRLAGYRSSDSEETVDAETNPKKRVAQQLLRIEKGILRNSLAAVEELISHLPNNTVAPCSGSFIPLLK